MKTMKTWTDNWTDKKFYIERIANARGNAENLERKAKNWWIKLFFKRRVSGFLESARKWREIQKMWEEDSKD